MKCGVFCSLRLIGTDEITVVPYTVNQPRKVLFPLAVVLVAFLDASSVGAGCVFVSS